MLSWTPPDLPVQRPGQLSLDWTAPAECPDVEEVHARLRAHLPGIDEPLIKGGTPLRVIAVITGVDDKFEVSLQATNREGTHERRLSTRDCSLLTDAVVLVIAVTIDPVTTATRSSVERVDEAERDEVRPSDPAAAESVDEAPIASEPAVGRGAASEEPTGSIDVAPRRERDSARRLRLGVKASGGGGYGPTNTGYGWLSGGVALLGERWRWAVDGRWAIRRSVVQPSGAGGIFDAWTLGSLGCFVPAPGGIELPLCGGAEAGQLRGEGVSALPVVERAEFLHVALRLSGGLAWAPIERLAVGFDLELAAPLTRAEFTVDDVVVQRGSPMGVRGLLGVELRLW